MGKTRRDFWEFVDTSAGTKGCWTWKGRRGRGGYGLYSPEVGTHISAHRYAWMHGNGDIPEGMFACHRCDNPACVNPEHIFIGTPRDNVLDMIQKGRAKFNGGKAPSERTRRRKARAGLPAGMAFPKGENHPSRKLIEDDVVAIRAFAGMLNKSKIARIYGVSKPTVASIISRQYWAHVA